jgi:hypothetical protein
LNEEKDLIFLNDFKKDNKKDDNREGKQTLELKHLKDLIDRGLYKPDLDKIAEAFLEKEIHTSSDKNETDGSKE